SSSTAPALTGSTQANSLGLPPYLIWSQSTVCVVERAKAIRCPLTTVPWVSVDGRKQPPQARASEGGREAAASRARAAASGLGRRFMKELLSVEASGPRIAGRAGPAPASWASTARSRGSGREHEGLRDPLRRQDDRGRRLQVGGLGHSGQPLQVRGAHGGPH